MNEAKQPPLITVAIPVFNGERFLRATIESVIAQTLTPAEILVVDDGSTDNTAVIAKSFGRKVRYEFRPHAGISNARNECIALARGDWIAFLDADDLWLPEKLREQMEFMLARPGLQFSLTGMRMFLEPGCAIPQGYKADWFGIAHSFGFLTSFLGHKKVFEVVGGFDPSLSLAEDLDWFARAKHLRVPMDSLKTELVRKRIHDRNISSQVELNRKMLLQATRRNLERKHRCDSISISVVIPVFNGERYLAAAIESVLAQTLPPNEVVVVDDGSTDSSVKIAESFAPRVHCESIIHGGISAARNHGINITRGNSVAFLDADDLWKPGKLERQFAELARDPDLEMIFCGVEQFISPDLNKKEKAELVMTIEKSTAPHCGSMLVQRDVFHRVGLFNPAFKLGEFIDWFARANDVGVKMITLPDFFLRRRWHQSNTTRRQRESFADLPQILKQALDRRRAAAALP